MMHRIFGSQESRSSHVSVQQTQKAHLCKTLNYFSCIAYKMLSMNDLESVKA